MTGPHELPAGHLTRISTTEPMSLQIDRVRLQRRLLVPFLEHGPDGLSGLCHCGEYVGDKLAVGWNHKLDAVAGESGLSLEYAAGVLELHRVGYVHCRCGAPVPDDGFGRLIHWAEVLAANVPAALVADLVKAARQKAVIGAAARSGGPEGADLPSAGTES